MTHDSFPGRLAIVYGAAGVLARRHALWKLGGVSSSFVGTGTASASTGRDARRSMVSPYGGIDHHPLSGSAMINASCALET